MRPATIRRLIVFGVCALGVGGLYLVPGVAGSPGQVTGRNTPRPDSADQPIAYDSRAQLDRGSSRTSNGRTADSGDADAGSHGAQAESPDGGSGTGQLPRRPTSSATGESESGQDDEAPSIVADLSFPTVTTDRLTVRWPAATDNVRVAAYRVWLNGYHVADTTGLQVAIPWFKDGSRAQVVQVRAVDAAGNQSERAPAQLVERPAPEPTPSAPGTEQPVEPSPSSNPTTLASASGSASSEITAESTESSDAGTDGAE